MDPAPPAPPPTQHVGDARPLGRVLSPPQFWALMTRWQVPDATALALIAYTGKPPPRGKRPRFRFAIDQQRITHYLVEVDAALETLGYDHAWLHCDNPAAPFAGRSPIEAMVQDGLSGSAAVLRELQRAAMLKMLQGDAESE